MDAVKKFYETLARDEAIQERAKKFDGSKPEDETAALSLMVEFAKKEGFSFTAEEVKEYMVQTNKGEIGDEDMTSAVVGSGPCACVIGGGAVECGCLAFGMGGRDSVSDEFACFCFFLGSA